MFTLYQAQIEETANPALMNAYCRLSLPVRDEARLIDAVEVAANFGMFARVARFHVDTLDAVYEVGNIGPEDRIERIARMRSVSVGDLIHDHATDTMYVVASFGFTPIPALLRGAIKARCDTLDTLDALREKLRAKGAASQDEAVDALEGIFCDAIADRA